ncbi:MAG: acylphosphatase [Eubacteriaceae bacterium]|nr:acylphosphatase [Eubacteriaceae bacterium]
MADKLKVFIKKLKDDYVRNQVRRLKMGEFEDSPIKRYSVMFSGRVQRIGFRLEVYELANNLSLTGFCENLKNGDVYCELQGNENKIKYLLDFMCSLVRIKIKKMDVTEIDVIGECQFIRM